MSDITAFAPVYTVTGPNAAQIGTLLASVSISATASSQAVVLTPAYGFYQIRVANQTASWAYVNFGIAGAVVAATVAASIPIAPGAVEVFGVAVEVTGATVILAAGATTAPVSFTRGNGL